VGRGQLHTSKVCALPIFMSVRPLVALKAYSLSGDLEEEIGATWGGNPYVVYESCL
jgi:hypothetical protein